MRNKIWLILLLLLLLPGCKSKHNNNTNDNFKTSTTANDSRIDRIEYNLSYDEYKMYLIFNWVENTSIFEMSVDSGVFILENDEIFPTTNKQDIIELVDKNINYKHIEKSYKKYIESIFEVEGLVTDIHEFDVEDYGIITFLNIIDNDMNVYQVMYLGELVDILKEDSVYLAGLPLGIGGFENTAGGFTNTIITLGSYIEKI